MSEVQAGDPLLELDRVSACYGAIKALHNISLVVNRGEIVTIIGANGAGKTTTLMCTSGVHRLSSGSVRFNGETISSLPAHTLIGKGLAQVPEGRKIFPRLTVLENLEMGAFIRNDKKAIAEDLERVTQLFPILKQRLAQHGGTLSGGEQQMLAIARALMCRPKMLLMDEPSMGVAPIFVAKIFETIKELNNQGMTILLVEQNAHVALKLAQRGYVIETGEIILTDQASNLLTNPKVREAYLGEEG